MGPSPITIQYDTERRRLKMLDDAAQYRMVKQALSNRPSEPGFGGIAHTARTVLISLSAIAIRLHAKPAALAPSHR